MTDRTPQKPRCELCGRLVPEVTRHHLIPRTRHRNKRNKKEFSRVDAHTRLAWLCPACHDQIHATFDAKQLEREYSTIDAIRSHESIAAFVAWLRKKDPSRHVTVRGNVRRRTPPPDEGKRRFRNS